MTRWQRTTPDAGDPAGIRRVAARRESWADELGEHSLTRLRDVIGDASDSRWTGAAATAFSEQAGQLPGLVSGLIERARDEADALRRYAAAIDRIADEAAALRTQLAGLRSAISRDASRLRTLRAADDPAEADRIRAVQLTSDLAGSRHSLASLDARWDELADERRRADATCAAALRPPPAPPIGTLNTAQLGSLTDAQVLTALAGLTPLQLAELLRRDHALASRIADLHDPQAIASWWRSLASSDPTAPSGLQAALVALAPTAIGNLDGVAYWARDAANRATLSAELHRLESLAAQAERIRDEPGRAQREADLRRFLSSHGFRGLSDLTTRLGSLQATRAALRQPGVTTQLVTLTLPADPSQPPLAAVSVGDLDRAARVTVDVPGMGSTVADTMRSWTADAGNLYSQQRYLQAHGLAPTQDVAVVAWIGYDAPDMPPSVEVLSSAKAEVGATHLASFLQGVTASHDWAAGRNLSVVAHSYGTTTAAIALEHTPVENYTMLASAGLDPGITSASDLRVDPGHVWATQSSLDLVAPIGRGESVPVDLGGRHLWLPVTPTAHPVNPADPAFGARVFTSEDVVWDGTAYPGSDGHDVSPQIEHALDHTTGYDYGYLDRGTISLRNTAETSLGLTDVATARNTTPVPVSPAALRDLSDGFAPPLLPANYGLPWGPPT